MSVWSGVSFTRPRGPNVSLAHSASPRAQYLDVLIHMCIHISHRLNVLHRYTDIKQLSAKALASHMRARHGARSPIKRYVDDSATCPSCKTFFCTRIRVIKHLSDSRRPTCRDRILADDALLLPMSLFQKLEARDRVLRREALHSGHTHPIASGSASTAAGRRIGSVTR